MADGKAVVIRAADLRPEPGRLGRMIEGKGAGAPVSFINGASDEVGAGPPMHSHPYPEIHIVRQGRVRYTVDGEEIEAEAGDVVIVPAGARHTLTILGPGHTEDLGVHLSPEFTFDWVENPGGD